MRYVGIIAKRELQSYFNSPIAYVVLGVFLLLLGYFFFSTLFLIGLASMRNFFSIAPLMLVIFGPAVSMRLLAEESKSGTLELLLNFPVEDYQVILGKFFGGLAILSVGLLFTIPFVLTVSMLAPPNMSIDWGPVVGGYFGLMLLTGSFVAVGLFASSLTKNQIVAFILGFVLCLFFFMADKIAYFMPSDWARFFEYLSVDTHFNNISRGVIDSRDLVYYLSLTAVCLYFATRFLRKSH